MKKCISCGSGFLAVKSVSLNGLAIFCSQKCMGRWRSRNPIMSRHRGKGGRRVDLNNRYFRSSWEANYARYLNFLIDKKQIMSWEFEVDTFDFVGIKRGARFYTPDFKIKNINGTIEYHEVKGWMDLVSKTKLKRMKKYYPAIKVILIDKSRYSAIGNTARNFIPNWEREAKKGY